MNYAIHPFIPAAVLICIQNHARMRLAGSSRVSPVRHPGMLNYKISAGNSFPIIFS